MKKHSQIKPDFGVFEGCGKTRTVYLKDVGLVSDFMISDDFNECVTALVGKRTRKTSKF